MGVCPKTRAMECQVMHSNEFEMGVVAEEIEEESCCFIVN